jgi:yeast amino acid transporter
MKTPADTLQYCASRSLYGMALEGRAPKFLTYCPQKGLMSGVPIVCLGVTMIFPCLSFLQVSNGSAVVLNWLINLVTAGGVITYIVMATTYIFFYNACKAQGIDRRAFPYYGYFQPYGAYLGLAWMIMIVTCYGYSSYAPWSTQSWFIYYALGSLRPLDCPGHMLTMMLL